MDELQYQQDPLRAVQSFSGTVINTDDIIFKIAEREEFQKLPSEITTDVLQKMIAVSASVRELSKNEDFKNLMWYLQQIKDVSSLYTFNPMIDNGAKSVWYQQLSLVMGFEGIFNDFLARSPAHYESLLKEHIEDMQFQKELEEGAE